jgi:hypothetical protein
VTLHWGGVTLHRGGVTLHWGGVTLHRGGVTLHWAHISSSFIHSSFFIHPLISFILYACLFVCLFDVIFLIITGSQVNLLMWVNNVPPLKF